MPITVSRLGRLLGLLALFLIEAGCGDVFRPVAVPVTPSPPDPASLHFVLVVSDNGSANSGVVSRIDVSGDTNVAQAKIGAGPVHAVLVPGGSRAYIANAAESTVSTFSLLSPTLVTTISLPTNTINSQQVPAVPVFVETTESANVYVADSANGAAAAGRVFIVSVGSNIVTAVIPVGTNPMALAEMPNGVKVYAVNQGDGTVSSITTADKNLSGPPIPTGVSPVWALVRADSARLYVLNSGDGTVSVIDTSSDTVIGSVSVGVGANYMVYDPRLNRIYVNNPAANTVTALNISNDPPTVIFTTPVAANPVSIAALPDGSRVYAASAICSSGTLASCAASGGTVTSQVTVINASDGSVKTNIPLATVPALPQCSLERFDVFVAAAASGNRVYVSNCDQGQTAAIRTAAETLSNGTLPADTFVLDIPAPVSAYPPPVPVNGLCPPTQQPANNGVCQPPKQNPVFILSGL